MKQIDIETLTETLGEADQKSAIMDWYDGPLSYITEHNGKYLYWYNQQRLLPGEADYGNSYVFRWLVIEVSEDLLVKLYNNQITYYNFLTSKPSVYIVDIGWDHSLQTYVYYAGWSADPETLEMMPDKDCYMLADDTVEDDEYGPINSIEDIYRNAFF